MIKFIVMLLVTIGILNVSYSWMQDANKVALWNRNLNYELQKEKRNNSS